MTANGIDSRVRRGSLREIQPGVYLAGPVMPPPAQEMAERLLLALLRKARLPPSRVNARIATAPALGD